MQTSGSVQPPRRTASFFRLIRGPAGRHFQTVLILCLLLALVGFAWNAIALLYDGRYSVTRQDFWRIYLLDLRQPFPLDALHKHNNHPVFFPSLVWLTVLHFFGNDQTLLFFCGLGLTLLTLVLLLVSLWRSQSLNLTERLILGLLYTVGTLWVGKANITASGGFSCMNSLASIGFVASLLCLHGVIVAATTKGRTGQLLGASLAAVLASFSFGTGLAAWGACLAVALMNRLRWQVIATFVGGGFLTAVLIVLMPDRSQSGLDGMKHFLPDLPGLLVRFAQLVGAPWFAYGQGWIFPQKDDASTYVAVGWIGLLGLLAATYFVAARLRDRRPFEPAETVAFGMMLGMLGSLALVALGRSEMLIPQPHEVLAPRYYFWSAFFWAALPVLAFYAWPRLRVWRTTLTLVAILFAVGAIPSQRAFGKIYAIGRRTVEAAALRLVCRVEDEKDRQDLFRGAYSKAIIYPLAEEYRRRGLDMFAWPGAKYVGGWMNWPEAEMKTHRQAAMGHWRVDQVFAGAGREQSAARFIGWSITRQERRVPQYVLIAQGNGRIVGLGRFTFPFPGKNEKYHFAPDRSTGFEGYIQNYSPTRRYSCRVVVEGELVSQELAQLKVPPAPPTLAPRKNEPESR